MKSEACLWVSNVFPLFQQIVLAALIGVSAAVPAYGPAGLGLVSGYGIGAPAVLGVAPYGVAGLGLAGVSSYGVAGVYGAGLAGPISAYGVPAASTYQTSNTAIVPVGTVVSKTVVPGRVISSYGIGSYGVGAIGGYGGAIGVPSVYGGIKGY